MSKPHIEDVYEHHRLPLSELRKIKKYRKVTDEEGEAIIDDAIALARMILDIID